MWANTLAYFAATLATKKNRFVTLNPGRQGHGHRSLLRRHQRPEASPEVGQRDQEHPEVGGTS